MPYYPTCIPCTRHLHVKLQVLNQQSLIEGIVGLDVKVQKATWAKEKALEVTETYFGPGYWTLLFYCNALVTL